MKYLNALNTISGLGSKKMSLLMNFFSSGKEIWHANFTELCASGIGEALSQKIVTQRALIDPEKEWQKLEAENILIALPSDIHYPALLKEIPDSPYLIYLKGNLACLELPLVAIVGSRKITSYGLQVARSLARDLAKNGVCVVSGLAFGVDACAHLGALEVKGKTIAVLGNSLDDASIAPRSNFNLSQDILQGGGLLISEFPVKTSASIGTFPARNRIMAGMSMGTLVVEAAEKSGSLITANLAVDYNRDVFAVPGSIFSPQSTGTHSLIKKGAKLITCARDVMEELNLNEVMIWDATRPGIDLTADEIKVLSVLSHESLHIDRIIKLTKLDTLSIGNIITMLEIKAAVKDIGGQNYIKI